MPTVLHDIVAHKRLEVAERQERLPLSQLEKEVSPGQPGLFEAALRRNPPGFILEVKPASPSAGVLAEAFEMQPLLEVYNASAQALSVLTDSKFFQGSLSLLEAVVAETPHPVLCKDFILTAYQVLEARKAGASAVLLIVKILEDGPLAELFTKIQDLGMTPVVEIQNEAELERALALSPPVLLINNRNLDTFEISFDTTRTLSKQIPPGVLRISASGIETRSDIDALLPDADAFLIGSALMRMPLAKLPEKLGELCGR